MAIPHSKPNAFLLAVLSIVSIVWTSYLILFVCTVDFAHLEARAYSYEGYDFPAFLPMKPRRPVELLVEESVHYSLTDPEAEDEWFKYLPPGAGTVRLGNGHRPFIVAMFHQLHCLWYLRSELTNTIEPNWPHVQHCFNLLRNAVLCRPDLTLEAGDFTLRNFTEERTGASHVCRDWEALYDEMVMNRVSR
ncbi:hypothetical protein BV25DRAFT_1819781, partial [Artomyces pyxidatus]